ncbi:MAG: hypothetical protein QM736_13460 [Vicinamibacterales bacterium]
MVRGTERVGERGHTSSWPLHVYRVARPVRLRLLASHVRVCAAAVQLDGHHIFSSNLRYRWGYLPGSEFFVVYTDERDTTTLGYPGLRNRAFVVKVNRLLRLLARGKQLRRMNSDATR